MVQDKRMQYPSDAYFYTILAKAYTAKNKNLLRFQAQGEAYYRQYNLKKAIEQMGLIPLHYEVSVWATKSNVTYVARADQYTLAQEAKLKK